jgi:hypothetical protein
VDSQEELGVGVGIYSTPCLFAAQSAMDAALTRLTDDDGRLPETRDGAVGGEDCLELLDRNLSRHHRRA